MFCAWTKREDDHTMSISLGITNRDESVTRAEAAALKRLWEEFGNMPQAEFGEVYNIGGQSAVNNFLNGRSSLSLKAATGFAIGLGVFIRDFSPRLDAEAQLIAKATHPTIATAEYDHTLGEATSPPLLGELRFDAIRESVVYENVTHLSTQHVAFWMKEDAYAVRIVGDYFFPRYRSGEILVLATRAPTTLGTDALVTLDDLTRHLVQWNRETDREVSLLPLNGVGRPLTVKKTSIQEAEEVLGSVPASRVFDVAFAITSTDKINTGDVD